MRLATILLVVAIAAGTVPPLRLSKAEMWSEAVAKFVTDPQFYRQVPVDQIEVRFLPLLRPGQLIFTGGNGLGRNPEMGIVHAFTNLRTLEKGPGITRKLGIESIDLALPPTDPDGNQIYPILRAKLLSRLRRPVWHLKVDDKFYFWRRGKTHYFVSIKFAYAPDIPLPGPGPLVMVGAGWEEGESEDP
jgi:hypothetical protein